MAGNNNSPLWRWHFVSMHIQPFEHQPAFIPMEDIHHPVMQLQCRFPDLCATADFSQFMKGE